MVRTPSNVSGNVIPNAPENFAMAFNEDPDR